MTTNETILKLAAKQAELTNKLAECAVLRNQIAELKKQSKISKPKATKPAVKKPSTSGRKSVKKAKP